MTSIYNKLKQLQYKEDYPFHMPGHKRNLKIDSLLDAISKIDITEITGFDDLHHPEEMIRELMDDLKQIYGTKESYLLVNSSTAGNLAAIAALCNIGDKILVARNCHKSVYHAIELLGLDPIYPWARSRAGRCGAGPPPDSGGGRRTRPASSRCPRRRCAWPQWRRTGWWWGRT